MTGSPMYSWVSSGLIKERTYIPKYYDRSIDSEYERISSSHNVVTLGELVENGKISVRPGHEIGKSAYGTGDIPFVRTSDIVNWEIKAAPKQGVSQDWFDKYSGRQNVEVGDILFVRDGTYLIGRSCFVTAADQRLLYQSHVLQIKVLSNSDLTAEVLFLAINSELVQREIRSKQFTADTIDTLGNRFFEIRIPIPKSSNFCQSLARKCRAMLEVRESGKLVVKQFPTLAESALLTGSVEELDGFRRADPADRVRLLVGRSLSSELGAFAATWVNTEDIVDRTYLPKFYDKSIRDELASLSDNCDLVSIQSLIDEGRISVSTGVEPGKQAYGTGSIPFIRTTDFSNWEVIREAKQGVSSEVYEEYKRKGSVAAGDILLVRDGTYLVGTSCIVSSTDGEALFCGGLLRFRVLDPSIDPYLLLGLFNSFIVKRQLRARQFTRDVIDTLGPRYSDVLLPIPRDSSVGQGIANLVKEVVEERVAARNEIGELAASLQAGRVSQ